MLFLNNYFVGDDTIDCRKMLRIFESSELTSKDYSIDVAVGEITVYPKRDKIYEVIEERAELILTNASIYDERIAQIIRKRGRLYISVDAGTKETYQKIKGVDLFDKVQENLIKYRDTVGFAPYEIKYIFMPGINDNEDDVDGFVKFCKAVETESIQISYDFYAPQPQEQTLMAVKRLADALDSEGMSYKIISDVINEAFDRYGHG